MAKASKNTINFNEIFKDLMKSELVSVDDNIIIDVIGSVHKDIASEAKKNGFVITPWGKYEVVGEDLKFTYKLDDAIESNIDAPWEAFDSLEVESQPWVRLNTVNYGDVDFGEIFWSAVSVAMSVILNKTLNSKNADNPKIAITASIPITAEIGTYEIEDDNLVFKIGKTLKQILKEDQQNDAK